MARLVLILLSASIVFAGCSCDDDDNDPVPKPDAGQEDSGTLDASMDSSTADSGNDASTASDSATADATADATTDASSDNDAGYDAGDLPLNACGGEMCNLLSTDSCTTAGDGCQFLLPPLPDTSPIPFAQCQAVGAVAEGGDCNEPTDCAPGLDCTSDGTSNGKCRSYCCNLNRKSGCPGEQACVIELTDENDDPTGVGLCDDCDACDPLDSAGSCNSSGAGCYPIPGNNGRVFSACTLCLPSTMNLTAGESCRSVNDCAAGLGCFRLNNRPPVCVQMCDLQAATDPCTGTPTCQDRLGAASQSGAVGVCIQ